MAEPLGFSVEAGEWPATPATAALILDFDGTLAPIVDDPATSRMPSTTAAVVARLARSLGRVAIVSGRPAAFLAQWAAVPGVDLVGLYGLERVIDGSVVPDERVVAFADQVVQARTMLHPVVAAWAGARLEDKGLALAVHWRQAEAPEAAAAALSSAVRAVAAECGLRADDGKMVVEVRPDVETDKGRVVLDLATGFGDLAFAGDDVGDLPAFAAVSARGGLRIAVDHGVETSPAIREAGDLVVDGVAGMAAWLTQLADRVDPPD